MELLSLKEQEWRKHTELEWLKEANSDEYLLHINKSD